MTTHQPNRRTSNPDPVTSTAAPAPATVWWLTGDDGNDPARPSGGSRAPFAARLSRRLILTFTQHGDTIIDLAGDPYVQAAARRCARTYIAVTKPSAIAALDPLPRAGMIMLRWPFASTPATTRSITDLFLACHLMTSTAASVIAITSTPITASGLTAALPAATAAGYQHALEIIAMSWPDERDRYLFYANPGEAAAAAAASHDRTDGAVIDLFVRQDTPAATHGPG